MTLKPPPPGHTHWSSRELARRTQVWYGTICRIWRGHALKPHRVETFKFTTDPEAEHKIRDIAGLDLNPPDNTVVLSVDEKTQIQALNRTQPLLPLRPGLPARQTHDYPRSGLTSLYAALEIGTGSVMGECRERHTGIDSLGFLARIERNYPGRELHVIIDNSSTHDSRSSRARAAVTAEARPIFSRRRGATGLTLQPRAPAGARRFPAATQRGLKRRPLGTLSPAT